MFVGNECNRLGKSGVLIQRMLWVRRGKRERCEAWDRGDL